MFIEFTEIPPAASKQPIGKPTENINPKSRRDKEKGDKQRWEKARDMVKQEIANLQDLHAMAELARIASGKPEEQPKSKTDLHATEATEEELRIWESKEFISSFNGLDEKQKQIFYGIAGVVRVFCDDTISRIRKMVKDPRHQRQERQMHNNNGYPSYAFKNDLLLHKNRIGELFKESDGFIERTKLLETLDLWSTLIITKIQFAIPKYRIRCNEGRNKSGQDSIFGDSAMMKKKGAISVSLEMYRMDK